MSIEEVLAKHGIDPASVRCGVFCPTGWIQLVDRLLTDLRAMGWKGQPEQIKEKFGGLRFYVDSYESDRGDADARISAAESESMRTCEDCGAPGTTVTVRGWMKTTCPEHTKP